MQPQARRIRTNLAVFFSVCFACAGLAARTWAQGVLVPDTPEPGLQLPRPFGSTPSAWSYKIKSLSIQAAIEKQFARTEVSQTFTKTGSAPIQARFMFPLPYEGAVDRMTFLVDGKEYSAKLMNADEARRIVAALSQRLIP